MSPKTLWLWLFITTLAITALFGVAALLLPSIPYEEELLGTSILASVCSLAALGIAVISPRTARLLIVCACLALAVAFGTWLALIWLSLGGDAEEVTIKTAGTASITAVVLLHAGLLGLLRPKRLIARSARRSAIALAAASSLLMVFMLWELPSSPDDWLIRLMAAGFLLASVATIAAPVLVRIERVNAGEDGDATLGPGVPVRLHCPRCDAELSLRANTKASCSGCGLRLRIDFQEPRCACGYLLFGLPEPKCPECGREISEDQRWATDDPLEPDPTDPR